jgi:hypothetical protein
MNLLRTLYSKVKKAQDLLDARVDKRDEVLKRVLTLLGIQNVYIDGVSLGQDGTVTITYGWSHRGLHSSDSVDVPEYLFDAETLEEIDENFVKWKSIQQQIAARKIRAAKLEQYENLRKELGK